MLPLESYPDHEPSDIVENLYSSCVEFNAEHPGSAASTEKFIPREYQLFIISSAHCKCIFCVHSGQSALGIFLYCIFMYFLYPADPRSIPGQRIHTTSRMPTTPWLLERQVRVNIQILYSYPSSSRSSSYYPLQPSTNREYLKLPA